MSVSVPPSTPMKPTTPTKPEERLWLPDDDEGLLSVLLYATTLHLHGQNTELAYTHEIDVKQIHGLTRIPRNVERSNNEWLATHIRLYGPISQLSITKKTIRITPWTTFAFVVAILALVGYYLVVYPQSLLELEVFWAAWGVYLSVAGLMGFAVVTFLLLTRGRRRRL